MILSPSMRSDRISPCRMLNIRSASIAPIAPIICQASCTASLTPFTTNRGKYRLTISANGLGVPHTWYSRAALLEQSEVSELPPTCKSSSTSDFFIPTFDRWGDRFNRSDKPPETGIYARFPKPKPPSFPPTTANSTTTRPQFNDNSIATQPQVKRNSTAS